MGGDGQRTQGFPVSLKVKNTFIDVNSSFVEDDTDGDDAAFLQASLRKRQVSEPVPCIQRQLSASSPFHRTVPPTDGRSPVGLPEGGLLEEDPAAEEPDELPELDETNEEEPEIEKDPHWVLGRQETDLPWPGSSLRRQETEQCWPSWVPAGGESRPAAEPMLVHPQSRGEAAGAAGPAALAPGGLWLPHTSVEGQEEPPPALGSWLAMASPFEPPAEGEAAALSETSGPVPAEWANNSTVMMRNLPNKYTQQMLLEELNQAGFQGTFDFMYLPIDPGTHANRGYAFINFIDPKFAWMLKMSYEGHKMSRFNSDKVVYVAPAALQGFEANYAHYSTARVNRGDPAARPLFLCKSQMRLPPKVDGGRRRGGRRSSGSLIDQAARQQNALAAGVGPAAWQREGQTAKRDTPATPKFCPYCGGRCQPGFRFCQFCGASLSLAF